MHTCRGFAKATVPVGILRHYLKTHHRVEVVGQERMHPPLRFHCVHCHFLPLRMLKLRLSAGSGRRSPHLSWCCPHHVRQPADATGHSEHRCWRRPPSHHRHPRAHRLQAEVTWERPHPEAPSNANGQFGVASGPGVQRRLVLVEYSEALCIFVEITV